jgi:TrmH family RNA methyltransferase
MKRISSQENPTVKLLHALAHSGRERRKRGQTILDGVHLVDAWVRRHGMPELMIVSDHGAEQEEIGRFLDLHPGAESIEMPDTLFRHVSPVETPTGILALVGIPVAPPLASIAGSCVILEAIQDAGNLGSILRSAAAAGMGQVLMAGGCAHAWSPKVLRAAMGAHFVLRLHEHADVAGALAGYEGIAVATMTGAQATLYETDLKGPVAWLFGNEGAGLSGEMAAVATHGVRIPMADSTQSLNVAAAAAVCFYEELRQKTTSPVNLRARQAKPLASLAKEQQT